VPEKIRELAVAGDKEKSRGNQGGSLGHQALALVPNPHGWEKGFKPPEGGLTQEEFDWACSINPKRFRKSEPPPEPGSKEYLEWWRLALARGEVEDEGVAVQSLPPDRTKMCGVNGCLRMISVDNKLGICAFHIRTQAEGTSSRVDSKSIIEVDPEPSLLHPAYCKERGCIRPGSPDMDGFCYMHADSHDRLPTLRRDAVKEIQDGNEDLRIRLGKMGIMCFGKI
jgi:hypothetical protein